MKKISYLLMLLLVAVELCGQNHVFVETESFENTGGWVIDQQSFDVMGSSYLLAHGMGRPVNDATTTVTFEKPGKYHLWIRTKDWAPFPKGPGKFKVSIDGQWVDQEFGSSGSDAWRWYYGGETDIKSNQVKIALRDLTGFDGRCDALLFTSAKKFTPPRDVKELTTFRKTLLKLTESPKEAGNFDLVVVGGGMAGTCAAISASRSGQS